MRNRPQLGTHKSRIACGWAIKYALVWLCLIGLGARADTVTIYHYNPEAQTNRNLVLKNTFDRYFQTHSNVQLQPVEDRDTFQQIVSKEPRSLFILSDWHYRHLATDKPDFIPYFRGSKNNQNTFRKYYVARKESLPEAPTIAVSGTHDYVKNLIRNMTFRHRVPALTNSQLLTVPKDIDALLAVSFGMADAALATETSYEQFSLLYRNEHQRLTILGISQPQKHLVVCLFSKHLNALEPALSALDKMEQSDQGRLGLNLLGLDEWKLLSAHSQGGQPQ